MVAVLVSLGLSFRDTGKKSYLHILNGFLKISIIFSSASQGPSILKYAFVDIKGHCYEQGFLDPSGGEASPTFMFLKYWAASFCSPGHTEYDRK